MIKILKYILTALLFATLWSSAADSALMQSENVSKCFNELASEYKSDYSVFDTSDAELIVSYVSSQVYTSQNNARRTNIGQRLLVSFFKNGKLQNVSVCNNNLCNNLNLKYCAFSEPAHRLIRLRKLII